MEKLMKISKPVIYVGLLILTMIMSGCVHLGVSHLQRQSWRLETPRTMQMEFMNFDYEIVPRKENFGVRGMAYVKKSNVPMWAGWIGELWIQGYLSDMDGNVLAQGLQVFSPEKLEDGKGIPFDFALKPDQLDSGPLYVSFGYRMALYKNRESGNEPPFMAIERAVLQ